MSHFSLNIPGYSILLWVCGAWLAASVGLGNLPSMIIATIVSFMLIMFIARGTSDFMDYIVELTRDYYDLTKLLEKEE